MAAGKSGLPEQDDWKKIFFGRLQIESGLEQECQGKRFCIRGLLFNENGHVAFEKELNRLITESKAVLEPQLKK